MKFCSRCKKNKIENDFSSSQYKKQCGWCKECRKEESKKYIESKFESWMTWNNQGIYNLKTWNDSDQSTWTWQIDHIIPQSKLPYTSMEDDNFKKCWALENLRPLSAKQNLLDGNRR